MIYGVDTPITIWAYGSFYELANRAIEIYNTQIDEAIQFIVVEKSPQEIYDRLDASFELDELPNIILIETTEIKRYIKIFPNLFKKLDDLDLSSFSSPILTNVSSFNGAIYGVPITSRPAALFYNKTLANDLALDIHNELSWSDLLTIGKELKYVEKYLLPLNTTLLRTLMQSTGRLFYDSIKVIDTGDTLSVLTLLQSLIQNEYLFTEDPQRHYSYLDSLCEGNIFGVIGTADEFAIIKDRMLNNAEEYEWGVVNIPKGDAFGYNVDLGGNSWMVINKGTEDDNYYVFDFLSQLFASNNTMYCELAQYMAEEFDLVPAIDYAYDQLGEIENNQYFGDTKVIQFLLSLLCDTTDIYYGYYWYELLQNLYDLVIDMVYNSSYTAKNAEEDFKKSCSYYGEIDPPLTARYLVIDEPPTKETYYKYERFNTSGMVLHAYYMDGTDEVVMDYDYDNAPLQLGQTSVEIYYRNCSVYVSITVLDRALTGIEIKPAKSIHLHGDIVSKNDFDVFAVYDQEPKREVYDFTFDTLQLINVGETTINITYTEDGKTVTGQTVLTVTRKLISLNTPQKPTKRLYYHGERFDKTGMSPVATYSDGTTAVIPFNKIDLSNFYVSFAKGKEEKVLTISYKENGVRKSADLLLYKKYGTELDDTVVSQDMGKAGKGQINLSIGDLTYKYDDFAGGDSTTPISICHIYNKRFNTKYFVGNDWKLNIQQEVINNNGQWTYIDKKGKEYIFDSDYETTEKRSNVRCEKLGFDLFEISQQVVNIVDRDNNTLVFVGENNCYKLTEVHRYPSSPDNPIVDFMMEIVYLPNGRVSLVKAGKITDGKRHTVHFSYKDNLLSELQYEYANKTVVAKYSYDNDGQLIKIEKQHLGITDPYSTITEFTITDDNFEVRDLTSKVIKDNKDIYKHLTYDIKSDRVIGFKAGYSEETLESTSLSYTRTSRMPETPSTDILLSTYSIYKNTVSVVAFNSMGVVSKYSFDYANGTTDYDKITKVNSAQSRNFDYNSIADSYSDSLDIYHDDFNNDDCGWSGGNIAIDKYVCGSSSFKGKKLSKSFSLKNEHIKDKTTVYLSMWVYITDEDYTNSINVTITDKNGASGNITHKIDRKLGLWQFVALSLGQRNVGDTITVELNYSTDDLYIDDVRLTKAPYETPDDLPETQQDYFGKVTKSYQYNPVDKSVVCTEYTYDDDHQLIEQVESIGKTVKNKTQNIYKDGLLVGKKIFKKDAAHYLCETYAYDGYTLTSTTDQNGVETNISEGTDWSQSSVIGEDGSPDVIEKSVYYDNSAVVKELQSGASKNAYTYFTDGAMQQAQFGYDSTNETFDSSLNFEYDTFGNLQKVNVGEVSLVTMDYDEKHLNSVTYANGDTEAYTYDYNDRLVSVTVNDEMPTTITYSDSADEKVTIAHPDGLTYVSEKLNKDGKTSQSKVKFEGVDRILKVVGEATSGAGNVATTETYILETAITPFESRTVTKNADDQVTEIKRIYYAPSATFYYDGYNNLSGKRTEYTHTSTSSTYFYVNYNYASLDACRDSTLISSERFSVNSATKAQYNYDYYKNGNLKKITLDSSTKNEYEYDEHNRLVWEYNTPLSKAYNFTYDGNGNITEKKTYEYDNGTIGLLLTTDTYNYPTPTDSPWHDQLKSYNGTVITYDLSGNPTNYLGKTMTWTGRLLKKVGDTSMSYDINGLRTIKGNRRYYWQDSNLIMERWMAGNTENYIYYYYDENGVSGFNYNGSEYYYQKNIFGDILAIYDNYANLKCRYVYDAWGNHKIYDANGQAVVPEALNIGNINPLRYRGYYWDKEFGLYYLQTRYYDPLLGRFISPDSVDYLDPKSINGLNLYAYCGDNPVNEFDPTGHFAWLIVVALLLFTPLGGTALQVATSVVSYAGIAVASIFDEQIRENMNAIHWNPFNSNETATRESSKVSFYKGVPVFRTSGSRSGSFGAIFLRRGATTDDLNHERGHNWQLMMMGIANFGFMIGLPSWREWSNRPYYERPWEITADVFGGVSDRSHSQANISRGFWYLGVSSLLGPLGYLFLFGEY